MVYNEGGNELSFKLNDPTFSRSTFANSNGQTFILYTWASDCRRQLTTSTANLVGTPIKFSSSLSYQTWGHQPSGGSVLSSNNQILTVTNEGFCGSTYFSSINSDWELMFGDTHPVLGEHLIPVEFTTTFTEWTDWTDCTVTCGGGVRTRSRTCQSACSSVTTTDTEESESCNEPICLGKISLNY